MAISEFNKIMVLHLWRVSVSDWKTRQPLESLTDIAVWATRVMFSGLFGRKVILMSVRFKVIPTVRRGDYLIWKFSDKLFCYCLMYRGILGVSLAKFLVLIPIDFPIPLDDIFIFKSISYIYSISLLYRLNLMPTIILLMFN